MLPLELLLASFGARSTRSALCQEMLMGHIAEYVFGSGNQGFALTPQRPWTLSQPLLSGLPLDGRYVVGSRRSRAVY